MKILVTGFTGSLGSKLVPLLLKEGHEVTGLSRDEIKQREYPASAIKKMLGDVRDADRVSQVAKGKDIVYHLASLKCVDTLEGCPDEALKTIVHGTENVLHAQRTHGIPRVVFISTDKAVFPINAYGAAKMLAERLTICADANNVVCRYGNCLASRGSVLPMLVDSIKNERKARLTDQGMTRFWITLDDAARFVFGQGFAAQGGLKIPPMKAATLTQIAQTVASILDITAFEMITTGRRPGEKISECLRTEFEGEEMYSHTAPQFTDEQLYKLIRPIIKELA